MVEEASLPAEVEVEASFGKVKVRKLTLKGVAVIFTAMRKTGIKFPFDSLGEGDNWLPTLVDLLMFSPDVFMPAIEHSTELVKEDVEALSFEDALVISEGILQVNDLRGIYDRLKNLGGLAVANFAGAGQAKAGSSP